MKETRTFPLRLPRSPKEAEKVSALQTATYFADRQARVDFKAFDKIMKRRGGKTPRKGDEIPA
jgi:hypothetical protein